MIDKIQELQQEIDLLRRDMEDGKLHVRVCKDLEFRRKLAEAIALDYAKNHKTGWHYVRPVTGKVSFRCGPFMPHHWNAAEILVVPVVDLVESNPNLFSNSEWFSAIGAIEYYSMIDDWKKEQNHPYESEEIEELFGEILDWAYDHPKYSEIMKKADDSLQEKLIEKTLSMIKDELVISVRN